MRFDVEAAFSACDPLISFTHQLPLYLFFFAWTRCSMHVRFSNSRQDHPCRLYLEPKVSAATWLAITCHFSSYRDSCGHDQLINRCEQNRTEKLVCAYDQTSSMVSKMLLHDMPDFSERIATKRNSMQKQRVILIR